MQDSRNDTLMTLAAEDVSEDTPCDCVSDPGVDRCAVSDVERRLASENRHN
jgi:hypothetical protein